MNASKIKAYMREQIESRPKYFDTFDNGEINMTLLAEDAAQRFNLYTDDEIPEDVFEIALEVTEEYEG